MPVGKLNSARGPTSSSAASKCGIAWPKVTASPHDGGAIGAVIGERSLREAVTEVLVEGPDRTLHATLDRDRDAQVVVVARVRRQEPATVATREACDPYAGRSLPFAAPRPSHWSRRVAAAVPEPVERRGHEAGAEREHPSAAMQDDPTYEPLTEQPLQVA